MNGQRSGKGIAISSEDGTKYEGEWLNNLRHGKGVETWTDGAVYKGDYAEGKKVGNGLFKWADGSSYEGEFADNMIQG